MPGSGSARAVVEAGHASLELAAKLDEARAVARAPDRGTRRRMSASCAGKVRAVAAERRSGRADLAAPSAPGSRGRTGLAPAQHSYRREGERVDVGGLGHAIALGLLGRHVGERPDHLAGGGQASAPGERGDPEVHELGATPGAGVDPHDHVLRLDVAVDHAARVGVGQGVADVGPELRYVAVARDRRIRRSSARVAPSTSSLTRRARPSSDPSS